jgi:N utilization substance protein B
LKGLLPDFYFIWSQRGLGKIINNIINTQAHSPGIKQPKQLINPPCYQILEDICDIQIKEASKILLKSFSLCINNTNPVYTKITVKIMKARRVARELALLSLSQISKNPETFSQQDITDLVLTSIRTLNDFSQSNLRGAVIDLLTIKEQMEELEAIDPVNLERPIGAKNLPVPIPDTADVKILIDKLLDASEHILHSSEITEIFALAQKEDVQKYALMLIQNFLDNKEHIDKNINKHSEGWNVDRLLKMDRNILRIAFIEVEQYDDIPNAVAVDEAVELAKKYSSDESPRFINGVLGQYLASFEVLDAKES